MENLYETVAEGSVYERPDSPAEAKYENQGVIYETPSEVEEALHREEQVYSSREGSDLRRTTWTPETRRNRQQRKIVLL